MGTGRGRDDGEHLPVGGPCGGGEGPLGWRLGGLELAAVHPVRDQVPVGSGAPHRGFSALAPRGGGLGHPPLQVLRVFGGLQSPDVSSGWRWSGEGVARGGGVLQAMSWRFVTCSMLLQISSERSDRVVRRRRGGGYSR